MRILSRSRAASSFASLGGKDGNMNSGVMCGWIGGIAGGVLGLAGGVIGTYFSLKNTKGPLERSFMIKSAAVCWIAILIFLGFLLGLPSPYRFFMWIPYSILLPLGIIHGNRRQQAIRQEESQMHAETSSESARCAAPEASDA